jgi:hypothetical protein
MEKSNRSNPVVLGTRDSLERARAMMHSSVCGWKLGEFLVTINVLCGWQTKI